MIARVGQCLALGLEPRDPQPQLDLLVGRAWGRARGRRVGSELVGMGRLGRQGVPGGDEVCVGDLDLTPRRVTRAGAEATVDPAPLLRFDDVQGRAADPSDLRAG